jgi:hypothetical protein
MEASVKKASLPFSVQLRVRFKPDDRERPFDFPPFTALTKEPAAPAAVTTKATPAQPAPAPKPAVVEPPPPALAAVEQNPTQPQAPGTGGSLELMPSQVRQPLALPGTSKELITMLTTYSDEVKSLVDQGLLTQLWQPALNTKDVALGLDDHSNELPDDRRSKALIAVRRIVTSAWEIDAFADLGDKQKVLAAHNTFAAGVADLKAAYAR